MSNLIRAELYKLQRNKTFWALLFTTVALSALLHYLIIVGWWQLNGTEFDSAGLGELDALSTFTLPLLFNLIIGTLAGFFISVEFSQTGVIKNQVISGNKRTHIYMAKLLVFSVSAIIVTILIPLVTGMLEVSMIGYADILNLSHMLYLARALSLFMLQFLCYVAIVFIIAVTTEDSGKTIIFSILFSIVMFAIEKLPKTPFINMIYENSFHHQLTQAFNFAMTDGEIVKSVIIGVVTLIIITLWGVFIFNRKEIR